MIRPHYPQLLDQIDGDVTRFIADGAYDGDPTSALLAERFGPVIEIIISPPKTSFLSPDADENRTHRDQRITAIATRGRMASQASSSYNQRSRGETIMGRWKAIIGPKLKARSLLNQKTEARSQDWHPHSQQNDRAWPCPIRGRRLTESTGKGKLNILPYPCNKAVLMSAIAKYSDFLVLREG